MGQSIQTLLGVSKKFPDRGTVFSLAAEGAGILNLRYPLGTRYEPGENLAYNPQFNYHHDGLGIDELGMDRPKTGGILRVSRSAELFAGMEAPSDANTFARR